MFGMAIAAASGARTSSAEALASSEAAKESLEKRMVIVVEELIRFW